MSSVKVALRIRPLSAKERLNCNRKCVSVINNNNSTQLILHPDRKFSFDYIFDDNASQKDVYNTCVKPLLHNFIDGFNATILAYGQTGSGKTYSMGTGLENEINSENQGIIPRAIYELFSFLKKKNSLEYKYKLSVTYLELYNEDLNDLLNPKIKQPSNNNVISSSVGINPNTTLQIREDANGIINWYGVTEINVESPEELLSLLEKGSLIRSTGSTDMNMSSSRSHAIFSINLKQEILQEDDKIKNDNDNNEETNKNSNNSENDKDKEENKENEAINENNSDKKNEEKWICLSSKFHFVDLAGSERLKRTGAMGERVKEGITINQGLFALGNVINALTDESHPDRHVPYRDSKLTRLLQDSLGGNSKTLMLSCISCCELDYNESLNTLRYASRARMIKNEAIINRNYKNTEVDYQEFIKMKEEITRLRNELAKLKNKNNEKDENGNIIENNNGSSYNEELANENNINNLSEDDFLDIKDKKKQHDLLREKVLNQQCEIEQLNLKITFYESQMCDLKNEIVKAEVERDSLVLNLKLSNYESDDIKGEIREKIDRILGNTLSTNEIDSNNYDDDKNNEDKKENIENAFVHKYITKIENLKEKCMNLEKDLNIQYLINSQSLNKFSMYHDIIMGIDECYSQKKIVPVIDKAREEIQKQIEIVEKKKRDNHDVKLKKDNSMDKRDDDEYGSNNNINNSNSSITENASMNDISKSLSNDDIDIIDFKEEEKSAYESLLVDQLQNDIQLKEELLEGLLSSQKEYNLMKVKYEEKLKLLQNMLTSAQKDRDLALKKMNETGDDGKKEKIAFDQKRKLEDKIKKLENEISQLKLKYKNKDKSYSLSKNQNDNLIKNLKNNIENLKNEKTKLLQKIKSEVERNRKIQLSNEQEIVRLRRREKEAAMLAEKLEKNNQIQKALLKKKNEEAINSSKKIKSMMLLLNKNKSQTQIMHNPRTKSSTSLYQPRKLTTANSSTSGLSLYHSKSQPDASRKKLVSSIRTPLKTPEKGSKLLSLQVQWKKQSIDKEIEQFTINQELQVLYNDLLEKKVRLELQRKEIINQCKTDLNNSSEILLSAVDNENINNINSEIKSINIKIDKINQLSDIYNINETIHNNIVSYVGSILKNMISENIQQLMKIYIKELIELRSNFIYSIFHSYMDSECLDNLLVELKTAKKPYNLIKYYSKISYDERHPKDNNNLSYIKENESHINQELQNSESQIIDNENQIIDNKNDSRQISFLEKGENSKSHFKMEEEYNRMLRSLESLYNIKIQEEKNNENNEKLQNKSINKSDNDLLNSSHNLNNDNYDNSGYSVDDYYFSNHKRNLSEQNAIIYSNMINSLQQKLNQQKNTPSGKEKKRNETSKQLIHQRSRSLSDLETESIVNSKDNVNVEKDINVEKNTTARKNNSSDGNRINKNDTKSSYRPRSSTGSNNNLDHSSIGYRHRSSTGSNNNLDHSNTGYRRRSVTGTNTNQNVLNSNLSKSNNHLAKSYSYNSSINDLSRKDTPTKQNYSEYISKRLSNKANSKDDYEKTVDRLKCSITEKICNDIKKEIQDTYDIDISKKVSKNNKKMRYGTANISSDSIKEKLN